jgi:hypothetical protein
MKKYIITNIKQKIEDKKAEWAHNYVSMKYQETLGTPDADKQVESAKHNMGIIESTIKFLEDLLKKESPKK